MKKLILVSLLAFFALLLNTSFAQNDSIYVMKDGNILWQYKVTEIDSIIFYKPVIEEEEETSGTFVDSRDNREYEWVRIGGQVWMAENLKYLLSVVPSTEGSTTEPYCYVYDYNGTNITEAMQTENFATYGVLYNWAAAMDGAVSSDANPSGVQGICPEGWHLPSEAEWTQLIDFLGGQDIAGGKLKESGLTHWLEPNTGATNEVGFTALPGGERETTGLFGDNIGKTASWWSATENNDFTAWNCGVYHNTALGYVSFLHKMKGYSVRCVRDN